MGHILIISKSSCWTSCHGLFFAQVSSAVRVLGRPSLASDKDRITTSCAKTEGHWVLGPICAATNLNHGFLGGVTKFGSNHLVRGVSLQHPIRTARPTVSQRHVADFNREAEEGSDGSSSFRLCFSTSFQYSTCRSEKFQFLFRSSNVFMAVHQREKKCVYIYICV